MKIFLYPFAGLYGLITYFRNKFFDWGVLSSKKYKKPVIAIGNLNVGGTGKSPFVIYLINLLQNDYFIGVVSRGYGRMTKGFRFANYEVNHTDIGDEPMQVFERFRNKIVVGVDEKRVHGIHELTKDFNPQIFILDDAFQHRYVHAGLYILLTDYNFPYYKDHLLPLGRLREGKYGAKRAKIIVVTKCPKDLSEEEKTKIKGNLNLKPYQSLFFSKIVYDKEIISFYFRFKIEEISHYNILLVTGIAKYTEILKFSEEKFNSVTHLNFNDHHNYTEGDIEKIDESFEKIPGDSLILTTEKDYMRLKYYQKLRHNLFYLPINIELDKPEEFRSLIYSYLDNSSSIKRS